MELAPCPACDRHIALDERRCPFCDAVPGLLVPRRPRRVANLTRAAIVYLGATLGACTGGGEPGDPGEAVMGEVYGAPPPPPEDEVTPPSPPEPEATEDPDPEPTDEPTRVDPGSTGTRESSMRQPYGAPSPEQRRRQSERDDFLE